MNERGLTLLCALLLDWLLGDPPNRWHPVSWMGTLIGRLQQSAPHEGQLRPRLTHLCNPNNPTGQIIDNKTIGDWADQWPETLFVIDEAYLSFVPDMASAAELERPNILILRSMTKDYSLAGLRLGYALGPELLIAGLARLRIPWSVSGVAQAAGIAALAATQTEYEAMWAKLRWDTAVFRQGLESLDYRPVPSQTHYFLMKVGCGATWRNQLLQQGILVRLCDSYALPEYVRIAARTAEENDRFLTAIKKLDGLIK